MDIEITTASVKNCRGKEVFDNSGNKIGILKDFLINTSKSKATYILLSEAGVFNPAIEENYFVLPFQALQFENPEAEQLRLNVSTKKIEGVPKTSKARFTKEEEVFLKKVEEYYGAKENFTQSLAISENETDDHQSYEGSAESSDNESLDYNSLGDEVNYDKIKGIDKQ